jgi:predicted N-formylglutamate amidohydrolase
VKLIITCEHGGNFIPKDYKKYFVGIEAVLNTHRGFDIGALDVFNTLEPLANYTKYSETSRLLIELNRSLHHPQLFSKFTKIISKEEKESLIKNHYLEYRKAIENIIKSWVSKNKNVLHLSIHSFTPILNKQERHCDIGLLYDSRRGNEKAFCKLLKTEIKTQQPALNVRYNYPYLGKADGFTTHLRKQFQNNYLGIEIEINQKHVTNNVMNNQIKMLLALSLKNSLTKIT